MTKLNLSIKHPLKESRHFHQCLLIVVTLKKLKKTETESLYDSTHHIADLSCEESIPQEQQIP